MKCKLRFLRDIEDFIPRKAGDVIQYRTWPHTYDGQWAWWRELRGIYVICNGHGDFDEYERGVDVEVLDDDAGGER